MTPPELDDILDTMAATAASAGDPDLGPGLVTVESTHWVNVLSDVRATCAALHDGLRHRNIQVQVSSTHETRVLSRRDAGERGAPYRELSARVDVAPTSHP